MHVSETVVFIIYLICMMAIGIYFYRKNKNGSEEDYFLGGRKMGPWVSALSAGASDMSAWSLMGLPASVYSFGLGKTWIGVGLLIGYAVAWIVEAPRLRKLTIAFDDSITVPQYLTNRFKTDRKGIRIISAVLFLGAYTVYAASSMKACGTLFNTVTGLDQDIAMFLACGIIILYTFLGGYDAVCWTDFFQGMLMLGALLVAPIFAILTIWRGGAAITMEMIDEKYWSFLTAGWKDIISGLGWGLGYFGMPHIIVRFMSVESDESVKKSSKIAISWTAIILVFGCASGAIGKLLLGEIYDPSTVFIQITRYIFPPVACGILLSAILASSMSTADSQLLAASSAFTSDVYKPIIRKNKTTDREMVVAGRLIVVGISLIAILIARNPNSGSIMNLVENAWGLFGASFGPAIMLSLFWKRFNYEGACASIVVGGLVDVLWLAFLADTGIYEIIPGTIAGLLAGYIVTKLTPAPTDEVVEIFKKNIK